MQWCGLMWLILIKVFLHFLGNSGFYKPTMGTGVLCCQSKTDIAQRTVFDVKSLMLIYSTDKTTEIYHFIRLFSEATVEYS